MFAITMGRGILAQGVHMLLPGRAGLTHVLGAGGCHHVVGRVLVGPGRVGQDGGGGGGGGRGGRGRDRGGCRWPWGASVKSPEGFPSIALH